MLKVDSIVRENGPNCIHLDLVLNLDGRIKNTKYSIAELIDGTLTQTYDEDERLILLMAGRLLAEGNPLVSIPGLARID